MGNKYIRSTLVLSRHVRSRAWKLPVGRREVELIRSAGYPNIGLIGVRKSPIVKLQRIIDSLQTAVGEVLEGAIACTWSWEPLEIFQLREEIR